MSEQTNQAENGGKQKRPPYASSGLAEEALNIFKRVSPKKIDHNFVVNNNLSTKPNAFRILDVYRWFGIIDEEGNVNQEKMARLRMSGEEREKYIHGMIKDSYKDLFEEVNINEAKKDDIINFFIRYYNYTAIQATFATSLFVSLCQKYNISVSESLKTKMPSNTDKQLAEKRRKSRLSNKEDKKEKLIENPEFQVSSPNNQETVQIIVRGKSNTLFEAKTQEQLKNILEKDLPALIQFLNLYLPKEEKDKS